MPAKGRLAPNVSHAESIRTFRPSHLKDSHRPLPALFDFIRRPKNPAKVSLHQSPKRPVDNITAGAVLIDQYYRIQPMGCPLLDLLSVSLQRPDIRKEVARFDLAALFAFQSPVTENFNGNLAEVFRSSAAHYSK